MRSPRSAAGTPLRRSARTRRAQPTGCSATSTAVRRRPPRTAILDAVRLGPIDDATAITADQLRGVVERQPSSAEAVPSAWWGDSDIAISGGVGAYQQPRPGVKTSSTAATSAGASRDTGACRPGVRAAVGPEMSWADIACGRWTASQEFSSGKPQENGAGLVVQSSCSDRRSRARTSALRSLSAVSSGSGVACEMSSGAVSALASSASSIILLERRTTESAGSCGQTAMR